MNQPLTLEDLMTKAFGVTSEEMDEMDEDEFERRAKERFGPIIDEQAPPIFVTVNGQTLPIIDLVVADGEIRLIPEMPIAY